MPKVGLEETDVEELHGLFERCEIKLVEEIDPAICGRPEDRAGAREARPPQGSAGSQAGGDD